MELYITYLTPYNMRSLLLKLWTMLQISAVATGLVLCMYSCESEGLVDTSEFTLYYPGITDIGPSTNFSVSPSYHGAAPANFGIYRITFESTDFQTDCFQIDAETGVVSLAGTDDLSVGKYAISVSCTSAGVEYRFDDAIVINMLKPVPDGISMEPAVLTVRLDDVLSDQELPSSHVVTDGGHISIKGYKIATVRKDGVVFPKWENFFKINSSGVLSVIGGNEEFNPGKYEFDLKLNTYIVGEDSEEGIYQNALTINVTSGPLSMSFSPSQGKVEAGLSMKSKAPVVNGSKDGLKFDIKSVVPACDWIKVDPATGVLTIAEGNDLSIGDRYVVSMIATNKYGSKDFEDVYTITVVDYIEPITAFSYEEHQDVIQTLPINGKAVVAGEDITFYFKNELPAELAELTLNSETGAVTAPKGNSIPVGTYSVTVVAENIKSSMEAVLTFKVLENPYYFTTVRWGNNLDLTPIENYADQFRFKVKNEEHKLPIRYSDIPEGAPVSFTVDKLWAQDAVSVDSQGEITLTTSRFERPMNVLRVNVTVGGTDPAAITRKFYIFFHNSFPTSSGKYTIEYTPFVLQVNPKTGATSAAPVVLDKDGNDITSTFAMDHRGTFNYWCFDGKYSASAEKPSVKTGFLYSLWSQYYKGIGGENATVNTGERNPISAYNYNATYRLAYYRQDDLRLVVNPDKWRDSDGNYANGVFLGETQVDNNGKTDPTVSGGPRTYVIWVWFDTNFSNE